MYTQIQDSRLARSDGHILALKKELNKHKVQNWYTG